MLVHLDPEESSLTPVGTPRIPSNPIFHTRVLIDTPSDDGDLVVGDDDGLLLLVDAALIVDEFLG